MEFFAGVIYGFGTGAVAIILIAKFIHGGEDDENDRT